MHFMAFEPAWPLLHLEIDVVVLKAKALVP